MSHHRKPLPNPSGADGAGAEVGGILLTGGASRRLGRDKTILSHRGTTLAGSVAALLGQVASAVVEVGPGVTDLPHVSEDPPGSGPLAGIATGWNALTGWSTSGRRSPSAALVVACDMPLLNRDLLDLMISWPGQCSVVPVARGRLQFLCARYSARALDSAADLSRSNYPAVAQLVLQGCAELLGPRSWGSVVDEEVFSDLDVPADLRLLDGGTGAGSAHGDDAPTGAASEPTA